VRLCLAHFKCGHMHGIRFTDKQEGMFLWSVDEFCIYEIFEQYTSLSDACSHHHYVLCS
jgi:hypothetical protein